jgi:hypothetical protein
MALVLLEGLDRTGKSTVAAYFETLGFETVHLSAPSKGTTSDQYLQEMIDLISQGAHRDITLDRTHYGELIWPQIYGRKSLLDEDSIEILRELEESVGVQRIWMTDSNVDAHWKRCVDNKEPLDKGQFSRARALYSSMAHKYNFESITLQAFIKKFPDAQEIVDKQKTIALESKTLETTTHNSMLNNTEVNSTQVLSKNLQKTPEQHKLEVANIISDVLAKRILKGKGNIYDDLENELRNFLNSKLGKLLGSNSSAELLLSQDEVKFYKAMYRKATKGD